MISSMHAKCGCTHTTAYGFGMIRYVRCSTHYAGDEDDKKMIEAANNARKLDEANKVR